MKTTKKGFTLVELLVVIAILAILATVSVVGYTTFIQKANKSVDQQAVVQMNLVLKADEIVNGAPQSIDQVKDLLEANGYSDELTPIFDGYTFGWYAEANVMVLVENRTHVDFPEEYRDVDLSKIQLYLHNVVTEVVDNNEAISFGFVKSHSWVIILQYSAILPSEPLMSNSAVSEMGRINKANTLFF